MDDYEARRNRRKLFESLTRRLQAFYGRLGDEFGKQAETDLERAEREVLAAIDAGRIEEKPLRTCDKARRRGPSSPGLQSSGCRTS